jgi:hypothetical protein
MTRTESSRMNRQKAVPIRVRTKSHGIVGARRPIALCGIPDLRNAHPFDQPSTKPAKSGQLAAYINWLTFTDNAKSVGEDVVRIRNHPLVPNDIPIYGYIYDVKSGKLVEVPEATMAGRAC